MFECPGTGCNYTTTSERGFHAHIGKCKKARGELALVADDVEQHEAEERQTKRRRVLSPEHLQLSDPMDAEEPLQVDDEVCTLTSLRNYDR